MERCNKLCEPLEKVQERLDLLTQELKKKQRTNPDQVFFDNQEFIRIMNISKRTAQTWRMNQIIGFSMIGSKLYYKLSDILLLLQKNYKPSKPE
jgi:hypothetical protein